MARASYSQSSFLGGEWSPFAQGRLDLPAYRTAMNIALNCVILENGAAPRRSGFIDLGITYYANPGIIRSYTCDDIQSNGKNKVVLLELTGQETGSHLRVWQPQNTFGLNYPSLTSDSNQTVIAFSGATPCVMQLSGAEPSWSTNDTVVFKISSIDTPGHDAVLMNREFQIGAVDTTHFQLFDAKTGAALDGSTVNHSASNTVTAYRVMNMLGPLYAAIDKVQLLQSAGDVLFFAKGTKPWNFTADSALTTFTWTELDFKQADGPYIDPLPGTSQQNKKTATWTTADGGTTYVITPGSDGPSFTFASTDVGRCFRMFQQPAKWVVGTTYAKGDLVTYSGAYWQSNIATNVGYTPGVGSTVGGVQTFPWAPVINVAFWVPGHITAVDTGANTATVVINSLEVAGQLTRADNTLDMWQIGVFRTGHYPTTGCWHEGRLWLGGVDQNRIDAAMSGAWDTFTDGTSYLFSPTDKYDNVLDSSGISEIYYADDNSEILWMAPDRLGVMLGTANGTWLVSATTQADPITPTSIQIHQVARYKCANLQPKRVGNALVFTQAGTNRVYEYLVDTFSAKFVARPLNDLADHLPQQNSGIIDLTYQEDPVPCIWAATDGGVLLGCTYRRVSNFASEPPLFNGWHQHAHGAQRAIVSCAIASILNGSDTVAVLTTDSTQLAQYGGDAYRVEIMSPLVYPA